VAGKVGDLLNAIDLATGAQKITAVNAGVATLAATAGASTAAASITAGAIKLTSGEGADLSITGQANLLVALGLSTATGVNSAVTVGASRAVTATSGILGTLIQGGSTLTVDGKTITFSNVAPPITATIPSGSSTVGGIQTDGKGNSTVFLQTATAGDILNAIDLATGVQSVKSVSAAGVATLQTTNGQANSTIVGGQLEIQTGTQSDLSISGTGNALSALGLTGPTGQSGNFTASRGTAVGGIAGKTLTFSSFNGGTAVNVTFGTGVGQVQNLAQLNTALQSNNLSASIDGSGNLTISATNDFASSTLGSPAAGGTIGGSITNAISFSAPTTPIADQAASATRAGLVTQFNNILSQISTTTQDSSFNGINLLNGDQLKLTFDETGKSTLSITGVTFDSAGLGLSQLTQGVDFIDNNATNKVLNTLSAAATTLRSEASTLGSNLSIVEIRQDFNKNLINVLQTGSSNLTLADPNAEAANSQALTTRQQIAVSALALANQSQQSVLQLLR
jgi:flagellin